MRYNIRYPGTLQEEHSEPTLRPPPEVLKGDTTQRIELMYEQMDADLAESVDRIDRTAEQAVDLRQRLRSPIKSARLIRALSSMPPPPAAADEEATE